MLRTIRRTLRAMKRKFRQRARLLSNYWYDCARFARHASPFRDFDQPEQLLAYIWMLAHSIEKGLSLPSPRPGFGKEKLEMLIEAVDLYLGRYVAHPELSAVVGAVDAYFEFNEAKHCDISDLKSRYLLVRQEVETALGDSLWSGGTIELSRKEVWGRGRLDLEEFFCSRHSVRQFSQEPVERSDIEWAVRMAQRTPSVCNRQTARVHVFDNDDLGSKVLECQTGNRGFGHQASKVIVITVDLRRFLSVGERNQCWVDGGLFAMSLVWALHSRGIGTCYLNWSAEREQDLMLRQVADIPDSENIITLMAVGSLPDRFSVASSPRRDLREILLFRRQEENHGTD
jgi:nitroreductase